MLTLFALAVLALPDTQPKPSVNPTGTLLCQSDLPDVGGQRIAWFNLLVDDNFKPVSSDVFMRTDNFEAQWAIDGNGLSARKAMQKFEYRFALPEGSNYPVKVKVLIDGAVVAETTYDSAQDDVQIYTNGSQRTVHTVAITENIVPNIFGAHEVTVRASSPQGAPIANATISLPNWKWLERETRKAGQDAERKRRKKDCGPSAYI